MKKFIIGAVAAVALLAATAAQSNAQYPIARGVRGIARGAVRVATPGIGPVYARPHYHLGHIHAHHSVHYPYVYRPPVVAPRYYYRPYYYGYGYGWAPGVSIGVGRVGVRVGF
jgi:hypothetical protein